MTLDEILTRVNARATAPLVKGDKEIPMWVASCPVCQKVDALLIYEQLDMVALDCVNKCYPREVAATIERMPALLETFSAAELMSQSLGEVLFVVKDFLHQGLAILTADPKTGKSWWALDLCLCVASGQPFLGFETIKSGTLYLALEDGKRRLQGRMRKLLPAIGIEPPSDFHLATAASPIDQGLSFQIDGHIKGHPDTSLVVIDVLNRVRSSKVSRGKTAYEIDSAEFANIKAIADKHNICVLLVHHTRKGKDGSDVFQNISGSQGIIGGVDEGFMLTKENRTDERANLSVISREMGDKEMVLTFDKDTCRWRYIGNFEEEEKRQAFREYDTDPVTIAVRGMMQDNPWGFSTKAGEFEINMIQYPCHKLSSRPLWSTATNLKKHISELSSLSAGCHALNCLPVVLLMDGRIGVMKCEPKYD